MIKNLQQAIEDPLQCEEWQLKNWLTQLKEYIDRDTDIRVNKMILAGNLICPKCGETMALGAKNFCDKCGQKIITNNF